tara:strand:+ start:39 stop:236 length:198 start_codon:yes stop_codon:yes gene_type:complete
MSRKVKDARFRASHFGFSPSSLKQIADLKPKNKLFTCSKCGRKFMTQIGLENHLANYHGIFKEAV